LKEKELKISEFYFRHTASRTEQEAKGHLERQKIKDEAEGKNFFFVLSTDLKWFFFS
jgi:hypothetical protein